jgi:Tfp pilus assembly protein PilN
MKQIEINLLPKELRKGAKGFALRKNIAYLLGAGAVLVLILILISVLQGVKLKSLDSKITLAQKRMEQMRKNIELVDALSQIKDKLVQRMSAIEELDENRSTWVRILQDLSSQVPEYLWLSSFKESVAPAPPPDTTSSKASSTPGSAPSVIAPPVSKMAKVTIEGYTYSLNALSRFIINLMGSDYFKNIELGYVKKAEVLNQKAFSFQVTGQLFHLSEKEVMEIEKNKIAAQTVKEKLPVEEIED